MENVIFWSVISAGIGFAGGIVIGYTIALKDWADLNSRYWGEVKMRAKLITDDKLSDAGILANAQRIADIAGEIYKRE